MPTPPSCGLVCLASPEGINLGMQLDPLDEALSEIARASDLVDQAQENLD